MIGIEPNSDFNKILPRDVKLTVFNYLGIIDLLHVMSVCREWNKLGKEAPLWAKTAKVLKLEVGTFENVKKEIFNLKDKVSNGFNTIKRDKEEAPKVHEFFESALLSTEPLNEATLNKSHEILTNETKTGQSLEESFKAASTLYQLGLISNERFKTLTGEREGRYGKISDLWGC